MKKILSIFLLAVITITLVGCDALPISDPVNEGPVVDGITYLAYNVGDEEPNWSSYITAEDSEDGAIRVTDDMIDTSLVDFDTEGTYEVRFYVPDSEGKTTLYTMDLEVIDNRLYILNIIGESTMTIEVNSTFTDPGATALDLEGLPVDYDVSGVVDTTDLGAYILTYSIADDPITKTRTVLVVDTESPEIVIDTIMLVAGDDGPEDWLTYIIEVNDNYSDEVTLDVIDSTVNMSIEGNYSITILAIDEAGNETTTIVPVIVVSMAISLIGSLEEEIEVGSIYEDAGMSIVNPINDGLTVSIENDVNTSVVGVYDYTYRIDGYEHVFATREIHVVDTTAPEIIIDDIYLIFNDEINDDWLSYVTSVTDNYSDDITLEVISSTVDLENPGTYSVTIQATDEFGNKSTAEIIVTLDEIVININGDSEIYLEVGTTYEDEGAVAFDSNSEPVDIQISSNLDTSVVGDYEVTYTVVGYEHIKMTRTIHVVDTTSPTIEIEEIYLHLDVEDSNVDWITYVTDINDNYSNDITLVVTSDNVDINTVGTYSVTILASDEFGNEATYHVAVHIVEMYLILLGDSDITLEFGMVYTEFGAEIGYPISDDLVVLINSDIDMENLGDYTVTYTVEGYEDVSITRTVHLVDTTAPVLSKNNIYLEFNVDPIDWTTYDIEVTDNYSDTITIAVEENHVIYDTIGEYTIVLTLTDEVGNYVIETLYVVVGMTYANGVYDLSDLDAENKGILFAALESYLLDNVYGGVPLYTSARRTMYSDRTSLFSPDYNGVMGYGDVFSEFTADDSNVIMYGNTYGNAGEYTWRGSFVNGPSSLNPWTADDAVSSDFIDLFTGSLFTFYFDDSKTGFEINPEHASSEPAPVNPETINGKIYSTIWEIELRDDLVWTFHPDTDTTGFAVDYETLDADDYLWTWKYALDNSWFRAVSGGGDFISHGIKNAAEYVAGIASWEDVGIKVVDGKIQLEYSTEKSMYDVKYMLTDSWTPIQVDLFIDNGSSVYGTSPETVASSGVYVFDTWTSGQVLSFVKNDLHPYEDMYNFTGHQYRYVESDEQRFEEFLAGRLESSSIPSTRIDEFVSDPRVKISPDPTTWRLMINSFGTEENRDAYIAQYPNLGLADDFVPEPILQYVEMRQALYYGFDRYEAAVNVVKTYLPAFTYFASTYFLDAESGTSVRGTDAGAEILETYGLGTYGYSPNDAVEFFKSAVAKGIADGYYTAGTVDNYTTIEFSFVYASSGNTAAQTMTSELERQYEELFIDHENYVKIDIAVSDVEFPTNYYSYMLLANTDLGIGGISGSLFDAPSFLDVFNDDNISGFTLNWGIDTHSPNIPVIYTGTDGITVSEFWSYNALVAALNGRQYIYNGTQEVKFNSVSDCVEANLYMSGSTLISSTDGADLYGYITGKTLAEFATDEGFDLAHAIVVEHETGPDLLFVISETYGGFELVNQFTLATDAETAIIDHSGYPDYFIATTGPMTDADVDANAYLGSLDETITTVDGWAVEVGAPIEYAELWNTDWDGWSDVYVVLHIGDYYIGYAWL